MCKPVLDETVIIVIADPAQQSVELELRYIHY
jgi:hypothetical protein